MFTLPLIHSFQHRLFAAPPTLSLPNLDPKQPPFPESNLPRKVDSLQERHRKKKKFPRRSISRVSRLKKVPWKRCKYPLGLPSLSAPRISLVWSKTWLCFQVMDRPGPGLTRIFAGFGGTKTPGCRLPRRLSIPAKDIIGRPKAWHASYKKE